jgi:predicted ATPase
VVSGGWPTGTVTFLFTDVEGSTQRWRSDERLMSEAMRAHDQVLRSAIGEAGGVLFKHTGDGVIAAFGSPMAGLRAAETAQERLGLPVRMGLHSGEAELRDGDYFGSTLNKAARVMDAGHGGQVLASATTAALLDARVAVRDLGLFELKGLEGAERVFQVGDGSFPELRARPAAVGNIPRDLTEFVGRHDEMDELRDEIDAAPIVTLFGVGGTGKTRLSLELARQVAGSFADGCWLVELGQVTLPEAVPFALSSGVGMPPPDKGDVTEALIRRIAGRQMLIVVDNCEHLVDAAAEVIERIAAGCPGVRVIATSREPLMIRGERVVPVGPLPDEDGVELFLGRARAESPSLVLDERQRDAVVALCRRLDGLPLAIELAAARVRSMSPVELVAGLDERFRLLVGNRRSRTERHLTMRATLDWSYSLCEPIEQTVFDRLAVFPGEFDTAAAVAVAGDDELRSFDVQDALARLVDRSLIASEIGDDGTTWFRMLETMRVYGREHLRDDTESDDGYARHALYVADEVARLTALILSPAGEATVRRLDRLMPDILAALEWYLEQADFDGALRLPAGAVLTNSREFQEMMRRIGEAAVDSELSASLRAELDPWDPTYESRLVPIDVSMSSLRSAEIRADRDLFPFFPHSASLSRDVAEEILRLRDRFTAARPLTRYIYLQVSCISLALGGYPEEAADGMLDLEEFADTTRSELVRTGILYVRAHIAAARGDYATAAALADEFASRRSGYLECGLSVSGRFGAISWHALAGDPAPMTEVRRAWDLLDRCGGPSYHPRAALATAITLAAQNQRELGIRFIRWAARRYDDNILKLWEDELTRFDLPIDPEGPNEERSELLAELDFL